MGTHKCTPVLHGCSGRADDDDAIAGALGTISAAAPARGYEELAKRDALLAYTQPRRGPASHLARAGQKWQHPPLPGETP